MIYKSSEVTALHLEVTDRCNATCPMCARNQNGGKTNEQLPLTYLSLADIKEMLDDKFIKQLKRMYICGNYGDPIVAPETLEIFEHFRKTNPSIWLSMNTNGSARSKEWWQQLASVLGRNGSVTFGIDGLADTHSLYRKSTSFEKIIENAKAFIGSGGRARWDFIVFEHNEHQIQEAEELSRELGFEKFQVKKTGRFFSNTKMAAKGYREVHNQHGEVIYTIKPPKDRKYQNQSLQKEQEIKEEWGSLENYLQHTPINCIVADEKNVYLTSEGYVFPCCWTAGLMYVWYLPPQTSEIWNIINSVGLENINAKNKDIREIIDGDFFKMISNKWNNTNRLKICARVCGTKFNQFKDQFK